MMKEALFGEHALEIWIAGLLWSFLGIIAVKLYYLNSDVKFNIKYWLNDNLIDVLKGMFWAILILRLGDYILHIAKDKLNFTIPDTTDFVTVMIVISGYIQYKLHNNRKPFSKKIDAEMHQHNKNCKY